MTKTKIFSLLFLCLAGAPLWAMNAAEDKQQPLPLAAAAAPTSAPRKVRPEAFVFSCDLLMALKIKNLEGLAEKKREDAERAVSLHIKTRLPEETTGLLAPFQNVCYLFIGDTSSKQLS